MPLPASLVASIISAVIEAAAQSSGSNPTQYEIYATTRTLPPEAKLGVMQPPTGNGTVIIDGNTLTLAPTVQFRSTKNLIIMPMSIQSSSDVVYLTNAFSAVYRVWMINPAEVSAIQKN